MTDIYQNILKAIITLKMEWSLSKTTGKYIEKINKKYTYINKTIEETYTKENSIYKKNNNSIREPTTIWKEKLKKKIEVHKKTENYLNHEPNIIWN